MSIKAAIVLVVVVVVLFIVAVVIGGSQDEGDTRDRPALVDRLGEFAGDVGAVSLADVSAGCFDDDEVALLVVTGSCVVTVTSDEEIARLGLEAVAGTVTVVAPAPQGDVSASTDLDDDEPDVDVAVGDGETEITLICRGLGATCQVRVLAE